MTGTQLHPPSSPSNLMQDVPGAFPLRTSTEQEKQPQQEEATYLTLPQAVHARRAEYVRPKHVRIKIGTWNVAAFKGPEQDVGGWFVEGKGVTGSLAELSVNAGDAETEDVATQESRYEWRQSTLPKNDPGSLPGHNDIGLYVLGLQEIVDLNSTAEALRPYTDPGPSNKWKEALDKALPEGYTLIAEQQLIGLLLLVYASPELAPEVRAVSTTSVGTGVMGYMGNKGAVTARIVIGDTTRLVFINSHLAAGADKTTLERRNWDSAQIVQRTKFEPIQDAMDLHQTTGEQIGDEDFAFWVGDLNYRLEGIPGDDVRRLLMLHTRNEYDLTQRSAKKIENQIDVATESAKSRASTVSDGSSGSSTDITLAEDSSEDAQSSSDNHTESTLVDEVAANEDPTSLQTTLSSLLAHDELRQQMKARKAFQDGWREGPIAFLPTYKYDTGSVAVFDSSEKKRAPSWCDRILYRTRKDRLLYNAKTREEENARRKDEEMRASGADQGGDDEEILYDYDPDNDGANANDDYDEYDESEEANNRTVFTKEGFEDEIQLEYYTAHQRVLSSDHKPLDAIFMLKYDAVVPELKAKVHAEAAKDLDKAENEGRPNVTVVVDRHNDTQAEVCEETDRAFEGAWFGDVRWGQSKHRLVTIANTSRVPAKFSFIGRPAEPDQACGIAPSWLNLKLNGFALISSNNASVAVVIEPGDAATVELEIRIIDPNLVAALNEGSKELDDILVLRVEDGRDYFIPVRANWLDSSLGQTIDKLIRIPEGGIRKLQNQRPDSSKSGSKPGSKAASGLATPVAEDPVRFSAPRELFRLTEAVEVLSTRVIAEWGMTSADDSEDSTPWLNQPGWPFDEASWSERGTTQWDDAISEACNALDTDLPLEASLAQDLPRMQRLYVLSSLLLLFIKSMPDGIITAELWSELDDYLVSVEKQKDKPTNDDQRTAIQEILAQSPSHNISFILITSMLERISQEVEGTSRGKDEPPVSPKAKKSGGTLRRMTGTFVRLPDASHREQACDAWARIFAPAVIRLSVSGRKKSNAPQEKRRTELMEIFLKKDGIK